jgi:RNA polymerase sigma-70 factor (ECF subfamily)
LTDAILVQRARRGDAAAFEALVRRHYRAAYAVALSLLGNAMDAEDVCHDAFLKGLQRLEELRSPERFAGWLLQITRNAAKNFRAGRRVRAAAPLDTVSVPGDDDTARTTEVGELRGRLEEALETLSEVQRAVVLLHDMDDWRHREIAESLDISEGMSRQHLMVARRLLRERLGTEVLEEYSHD